MSPTGTGAVGVYPGPLWECWHCSLVLILKKTDCSPFFFFPSELLNDPSRVEEEKVGLQEEKIALTLHHEETWGAGKMLKKFEY